MSILATRTAQAQLVFRIWETMLQQVGPETARTILAQSISNDAFAAGELFAHSAPTIPCLEHFATVLERWQEGGALEIESIELSATSLSFRVTRCRYAEAYATLQLPSELSALLSCARDEPFAHGYSPHLRMKRSSTIIEGAAQCCFHFHWQNSQDKK